MTEFLGIDPTLEDYWRSIILFGRNVASYKFALAKSLLELAPRNKTIITLEDLAEPFSRHITEHLKIEDKQTTSSSSQFLDICRRFNAGEVTKDELINSTVRLGFNNVIDAFHNVNAGEIPKRFFTDERSSKNKGIIITDELFRLLEGTQSQNLPQEVEARWRLVETAWQLNISRRLIAVNYDSSSELLFAESNRRVNVTSCRDALNGYQKGKCFYSFADISISPGSDNLADVDHFFPHKLGDYGIARPIDGVWNLVLASQECNRGINGKFDRLPHPRYLARLHTRNEFFINSHHPIANTLIRQTGKSEPVRRRFLQDNYNEAQKLLAVKVEQTWQTVEYPPVF
jgi:hypothetical protein